jgi:hypothetical protein
MPLLVSQPSTGIPNRVSKTPIAFHQSGATDNIFSNVIREVAAEDED